jgi:hypothetical protein
MDWFPHAFEGRIDRHGVGRDRKVRYTVVFLPDAIARDLPFDRHPQLRIEGEVADVPVAGAFLSAGDGWRYLIVSPATLEQAGVGPGDAVEVRFRVADQEAVEVPDALDRALALDPPAKAAWNALTVGRRRGLAVHVAGAKTEATRSRRIAAVLSAVAGEPRPGAEEKDVRRLGHLLGRKGGG